MLRRLMKECTGIMALAGEAIKESAGYTNWRILDDRIREAGALLEALAGVSGETGSMPDAALNGQVDAADQHVKILRESLAFSVASLTEQRNEARYNARVLACAWKDDCRPPARIVAESMAYAVDQRVPLSAEAGAVPPPRETQAAIAERISREAHAGQMGKWQDAGRSYIEHIERVVAQVQTDDEKAVAWLHDVLEDTDVSRVDLAMAGIRMVVRDAVGWLTRDRGVAYDDYIEDLARTHNPLVLAVKVADLRDHLRPGCPEVKRPRYEHALARLLTFLPARHGEAPTGPKEPELSAGDAVKAIQSARRSRPSARLRRHSNSA